jgi:ABC-type polysaccharide/polyol phosphate export permease
MFWSVLNPLLLMVTYFFVLGIVLRTRFAIGLLVARGGVPLSVLSLRAPAMPVLSKKPLFVLVTAYRAIFLERHPPAFHSICKLWLAPSRIPWSNPARAPADQVRE